MYNLLGMTHNQIDGAFCFGFLNFSRIEWGTRGMICVYVCSQCGAEFRNLES